MKSSPIPAFLAAGVLACVTSSSLFAAPALTIYNQNFAVVRDQLALELQAGVNNVSYADATTRLEPDSVVLRDPTGAVPLRILEQSYRADVASMSRMLALFEGREIDFLVRDPGGAESTVRGRIVRAGEASGGASAQADRRRLMALLMGDGGESASGEAPIIEVDGRLRFSLPGEPVFPALTDDTVLRPTLTWQLHSDRAARVDAEVSYLSSGLSWRAAYNFVAPEHGDTLELIGWVTLGNRTGRTFTNAAVKLVAGDVNKLTPAGVDDEVVELRGSIRTQGVVEVTEKAFDEFHLYTLPRPVTLRDRESKQVEFLRAAGVESRALYVYDGAALLDYSGWNVQMVRTNADYGTQSNRQVRVMREFANTRENGLGLPLPAGRTRFYRRDDADGRLEFTGENTLEHTPQGETVRLYTGDAFDLVGGRTRTEFNLSNRDDSADEAFAITLRNRKATAVEIRVVEHLYRGVNWTMLSNSNPYVKTSDRDIEFRVTVQPDEEKVITYRVRYDWK